MLNSLRMFRSLVVVLLSAALMLPSQQVSAQSLRGRAAFAADNAPLVGAIVQVRHADGTVAASTLTSESGVFTFSDLPNGTYVVRVLRIGYRAFDAGNATITSGATAQLNITWIGDPVPLTTQIVVAGRTCRISADSGKLIANVWDEARKVLMSSVISERETAPDLARITYQRVLDSTGRFVRRQEVQNVITQSFRGYKSWIPDSLALRGYMVEDETGSTFYGPDASTLVSESFAGTHCFFMVDGDYKHPGDIGLRFEPATLIRNHVDIRGTFWIERKSWRLRSVEFLYTGLPGASDNAESGGIVEFASLGSGQWFVDNWRIRMPRLVTRTLRRDGGATRVVLNPIHQVLSAVEEAGGVVAKVSRGKTVLYERKLPTLHFHVIARDASVPVGGAEIRVKGADYVATADSTGHADLLQLIDGRYTLLVKFPALAALSNAIVEREVIIGSEDARDSVLSPTANALLRDACGDQAVRNKTSVVFGYVRVARGQNPTGTVSLRWETGFQTIAGAEVNKVAWSEQTRGTLVGESGEYKVCDVPRGFVVIRTEGDAGVDESIIRLTENRLLANITLRPRTGTHATPSDTDATLLPTRAIVEVRATDADGKPATSIQVEIESALVKRSKMTTDASGRLLLLDQPPGRITFKASGGATSELLEKTLVPGRNVVPLRIVKR